MPEAWHLGLFNRHTSVVEQPDDLGAAVSDARQIPLSGKHQEWWRVARNGLFKIVAPNRCETDGRPFRLDEMLRQKP